MADRRAYQMVVDQQAAASTLNSFVPLILRNRMITITSLRRRFRPTTRIDSQYPTTDSAMIVYNGFPNNNAEDTRGVLATRSPRRSGSSPTHTISRLATPPNEGVDWNTAAAGVQLWLTARQHAERGTAEPGMIRSMHIDALKYMQRALPADLTPAEVDAISTSLPTRVRDDLACRQLPDGSLGTRLQGRDPNVLRRMISETVCVLMAILVFLLPFLLKLLNRLAKYEREYQLSERAFTNSIAAVNSLGEKGLDLRDSVSKFSSGRLGSAIIYSGVWFVDGIVGGVNDGLVRSTGTGKAPRI